MNYLDSINKDVTNSTLSEEEIYAIRRLLNGTTANSTLSGAKDQVTKEFYSIKESATYLGVCEKTVRNLIKENALKYQIIGSRKKISLATLQNHIEYKHKLKAGRKRKE
jgi:excisionase family DNA binding protein